MAQESQSKLEKIAIEQRNRLYAINTYNNADKNNNYSSTHTRALSDDITPVNGKGTGTYLDTTNGGGDLDINGNPSYSKSGRLGNLVFNCFRKENPYKAPDTTGNVGQVVI